MLENFFGEDEGMSGGPKCYYNGKTVPCFVCTSLKSSVKQYILQ